MNYKFSLKSILVGVSIIAVVFAYYSGKILQERHQMNRFRLAKEKLDAIGKWTPRKNSVHWNLSGLSELKAEDLQILREVAPWEIQKIISVDLSDTKVNEQHLATLYFLKNLNSLDLSNTHTSREMLEEFIESWPNGTISIIHDNPAP